MNKEKIINMRLTEEDRRLINTIKKYFRVNNTQILRFAIRRYWRPLIIERRNRQRSSKTK